MITVNSWLCDPSPVKDRSVDAACGLCLGVGWVLKNPSPVKDLVSAPGVVRLLFWR